jgi:hypothetical protein
MADRVGGTDTSVLTSNPTPKHRVGATDANVLHHRPVPNHQVGGVDLFVLCAQAGAGVAFRLVVS